ncbi:MAG TPA: DAK2 domain-containing protein [Candidatus Avacidaminococcus intestinavium]|uniref:DAK2 domain-containing protein n=1 Tax=Candidatus Avacidaminococcus intestinavium TaxID=2840684 RepID=A0A9D1MR04_9FIRM|nr:DAK2 domain-containing protein [Candidatus Avacidaminococcus intestinavium]
MGTKQEAVVNGTQYKQMLLGAYQSFEKNYVTINNLNVFPVPDGDTGTNMLHTMRSVAETVSTLETTNIGEVGQAAARSAVLGARGNSGVILSQLLYGIGKGLAGKEAVSINQIGKAFQYGILYAYRAVSKPVEGTILTVARGIAKGTYHAVRSGADVKELLKEALLVGRAELARTPELLPALKEAGVVDAGGQGLLVFFEGCLAGLTGDAPPLVESASTQAEVFGHTGELDLEYPYCTEFVVHDVEVSEKEIKKTLQAMGNSLIVGIVYDLVKVHIHSKNPGEVLRKAIEWGSLHDIKIDNMADQHQKKLFAITKSVTPKSGLAVLSVAAGDGIADIMKSIGAEEVIYGGQSMNPPVEDFMKHIESGNAEQYIILPNNKNIVLAVQQVKKLLGTKQVDFIPTTNLAQGLAALLAFDKNKTMIENIMAMKERAKNARSASCSIAVRDSVVNGIKVKKGQYLGLIEEKIVGAADSLEEAAELTLAAAAKDAELISLYYGSDLTGGQAESLAEMLRAKNEEWEIELLQGGQPLYPLLIVIE